MLCKVHGLVEVLKLLEAYQAVGPIVRTVGARTCGEGALLVPLMHSASRPIQWIL